YESEYHRSAQSRTRSKRPICSVMVTPRQPAYCVRGSLRTSCDDFQSSSHTPRSVRKRIDVAIVKPIRVGWALPATHTRPVNIRHGGRCPPYNGPLGKAKDGRE